MQLTGRQIVDKGIISNYIEEGVQQQGVDVRLKNIFTLDGMGYIPRSGKTYKPKSNLIEEWLKDDANGNDDQFIHLDPGYYEIEFEESCNIPSNYVLNFKTRSSLVRCGALVHSGQFDAGFQTENMGAFLQVIRPITLEKGARLAQAIVNETYEVQDDDLYNGQWQNDKQRKQKC